ncbi:hypothetical protein KUCAC02_010777, partial [Chaenocephalus aceratus]
LRDYWTKQRLLALICLPVQRQLNANRLLRVLSTRPYANPRGRLDRGRLMTSFATAGMQAALIWK